jgi:hypothetical protein
MLLAATVLCWSVAPTAQEQAAPQEQSATSQEQTAAPVESAVAQEAAAAPVEDQVVETPRRVVFEEPASEPAAQPVETPQRVVAPEEPAAAAEPAPAPSQEAPPPAEQPAAALQEEAAETPDEKTEAEEASEPAEEPVLEEPKVVKVLNINDALPTRFFDSAATAPDPADPNRLIIGLHDDIDRSTFKGNDFRASTAAFGHIAAVDTISFRVEAPKGQRIAKITYTQRGTGSVIRVAKALGATQWVVGDYAAQLGVFGPNPSLVGVADFSETPRAAVDVSITTGLFAFAAATSGSASLEVTSAEVQVELVPATDGL